MAVVPPYLEQSQASSWHTNVCWINEVTLEWKTRGFLFFISWGFIRHCSYSNHPLQLTYSEGEWRRKIIWRLVFSSPYLPFFQKKWGFESDSTGPWLLMLNQGSMPTTLQVDHLLFFFCFLKLGFSVYPWITNYVQKSSYWYSWPVLKALLSAQCQGVPGCKIAASQCHS